MVTSTTHWKLVFLTLLLFSSTTFSSQAAEKVILQLRWDHQFQFAGYYAALWQGYYKDIDLDVEIRSAVLPSRRTLNAITEVAEERAHFGVGSVDALVARGKGSPLVLVADIFQQSAVGVFAWEETRLSSPADLLKLNVKRASASNLTDVELQAMLRSEGINPENVGKIMKGRPFNLLRDKKIDVYAGYTLTALWRAQQLGKRLTVMRPSAYGVDFYGDGLITHARIAEENPTMVARFKEASLKGWRYALENKEEIVKRISQDLVRVYGVQDVVGFNRFQSKEIEKLTLYPIVELGHVNNKRWRRIYEELDRSKMIDAPVELSKFIFDPQRKLRERRIIYKNILLFGIPLSLTALFGIYIWIRVLRSTVASRTADLEISRRNAEKANAAKSELLANMSHELRTPLNAVVGFSALIQKEAFGPLGNEKYREYLDDINSSGLHLLDLINDILDVSAVEVGSVELHEENVNISKVVEASMHMIKTRAEKGRVFVSSHIDPDTPEIYADRRRMMQIFLNLLSNAVKFSPKRGEVSVRAQLNNDGSLDLIVDDAGIGMDEADVEIALSLFGQADSDIDRNYEGTGLGLPLTKGLVELHGGTMKVKSEKGKGTTITITLPRERVIQKDC
jgi:signal transduction histidine kinase